MGVHTSLSVLLVDGLEREVESGTATENALKQHDRIGLSGVRLHARYLRLRAFLHNRTLNVKDPAILAYSIVHLCGRNEAALLWIGWRMPDVARLVRDLQLRYLSR